MSDKNIQQRPGGRDFVQESQGTVSGGGSLVSKLGGPRNAAILGAGGTVALVALLALRKNKTAASTSASTDGTYDSGPYDMWNQWEAQYEQLQEELAAQQAGQTSASGPGSGLKPTPLPWPVPIGKPPHPTPAPRPPTPKPKPRPKPKPKPKPKKKSAAMAQIKGFLPTRAG